MRNSTTLGYGLPAGRRLARADALEVRLHHQEVLRLDGDQRGVQIISHGSRIWITQAEDPEDYLLQPGERFTITRPGRVVMLGLG